MTCKVHNKEINSQCAELFVHPLYLYSKLMVPKSTELKKIIKVFTDNGLPISIESNLTVTDFLDVTLDLENEQYYPYKKPNNHPIYVSTSSCHPPSVIIEIPHMIEN